MTEPLQQLEGKYEILQKLQEGGMGAIYKVRHLLLDEIRVVKVMRPQTAGDPEMRRRFVQEAKIAIRVRHPNIAQLFDFSVDEQGTAFIVMEFIDGVTLQEVIASGGPPSLNLCLEIALQGLRSLSCIHRNKIIHRDISSDNLMLSRGFDGKPVIKLIDLGIARDDIEDIAQTAVGTFLGKARYSPPEQFEHGGSGTLGPAADVYSFGVMFYELLTGKLPIEGSSFAELAAGHLFKPAVPFDKTDPEGRVPSEVRELILKSIEKKVEDRIASANEFIERLQAIRGDAAVDVVEVERLLKRARSAQRREQQISETVDELLSNPSQDIVAAIDAELKKSTAETLAIPSPAPPPPPVVTPVSDQPPSPYLKQGQADFDRAEAEFHSPEGKPETALQQYASARTQFELVLVDDPKNAQAEAAIQRIDEAVAAVNEATGRRRARDAEVSGLVEQASSLLADPDDDGAQQDVAALEARLVRLGEARGLLDRVRVLDPSHAQLAVLSGRSTELESDMTAALDRLRKESRRPEPEPEPESEPPRRVETYDDEEEPIATPRRRPARRRHAQPERAAAEPRTGSPMRRLILLVAAVVVLSAAGLGTWITLDSDPDAWELPERNQTELDDKFAAFNHLLDGVADQKSDEAAEYIGELNRLQVLSGIQRQVKNLASLKGEIDRGEIDRGEQVKTAEIRWHLLQSGLESVKTNRWEGWEEDPTVDRIKREGREALSDLANSLDSPLLRDLLDNAR